MEIPTKDLPADVVDAIDSAARDNTGAIARAIASTWRKLGRCPDCQVVLLVLPDAPLMARIRADGWLRRDVCPQTGCYVAALPRSNGIAAVADLTGKDSGIVRDLRAFRHGAGETPIAVATRVGVVLVTAEVGVIDRRGCQIN